MKIGLFDFVKIIDDTHKHHGRSGQITDYDTLDKEYILHFDKITESGGLYWIAESTRITLDQVDRISRFELEKMK